MITHPRAGQAVRPAARGRRHRPRRPRRRRLRVPGRQRLGQDHHRPHAARAGAAHPRGDRRCSAPGCRGPAAACCPGSARSSRVRRTTGTCPAGRTSRCSTPPGRAARGAPGGRGSTRCSSRWGWPGSAAGRSRRTRSACGSGSGWPARCSAVRSCWCSTSRPTASTRRASPRSASCCSTCTASGTTVFLSSHLLAEVEQLCSRVGVLDRGRLVLQDDLATLTAPTGSTVVHTPDAGPGAGDRSTAGSPRSTGERARRPRRRPGRGERAAGRRRHRR